MRPHQDQAPMISRKSLRNFAVIIGAFFVSLGFKYFGLNYKISMIMAGILIIGAAFLINSMSGGVKSNKGSHLKFKKRFSLYYLLRYSKQVYLY